MLEHGAHWPAADHLDGLHVLAVAEGQGLAADQPGDAEPVEDRDNEDDHGRGRVEDHREDHDHHQGRQRQAGVHDAHHERVDEPAGEAGDRPVERAVWRGAEAVTVGENRAYPSLDTR